MLLENIHHCRSHCARLFKVGEEIARGLFSADGMTTLERGLVNACTCFCMYNTRTPRKARNVFIGNILNGLQMNPVQSVDMGYMRLCDCHLQKYEHDLNILS